MQVMMIQPSREKSQYQLIFLKPLVICDSAYVSLRTFTENHRLQLGFV